MNTLYSTYHGGRSSTAHYTEPVDFFAPLNGLPFLSSLDITDTLAPLNRPIPSLSVDLPNLTHLSIKDAKISNLGMMSCIRAPLISTIKLLHTGEATLIPAPIAAAYSNLPNLPDSYSRFKLQPVLRHSSQCCALVRVWTGCAVEERYTVTPFLDLKVCVIGGLEAAGSVSTLCPMTTTSPRCLQPCAIDLEEEVKLCRSRR